MSPVVALVAAQPQTSEPRKCSVPDALTLETGRIRRFLGMAPDEPTELTFFARGRIHIAHATSEAEHARALKKAQHLEGFSGAYMLVNGPLVPEIFARYRLNSVEAAYNGRATDANITQLRALYLDIDPLRIKGISATNDEKAAARCVAERVQSYLCATLPPESIGFGDSGNGFYLLVALEPVAPTRETTDGISGLLAALDSRFGTDRVKLDCSVSNAARLMPCPGTMKCKGFSTPERPHRLASFTCAEAIQRVSIERVIS